MFYNLMTPLTIHSVFAYRKNSAIHRSWCSTLWFSKLISTFYNFLRKSLWSQEKKIIERWFLNQKSLKCHCWFYQFFQHCAIQSPITTHFPFWIKFTWSRLRISMSSSSSTLLCYLKSDPALIFVQQFVNSVPFLEVTDTSCFFYISM